jgi:hypothetical protein
MQVACSARSMASRRPVAADLTFLGREVDSLVFQVSNGVVPTGYNGTDAPGSLPSMPPRNGDRAASTFTARVVFLPVRRCEYSADNRLSSAFAPRAL